MPGGREGGEGTGVRARGRRRDASGRRAEGWRCACVGSLDAPADPTRLPLLVSVVVAADEARVLALALHHRAPRTAREARRGTARGEGRGALLNFLREPTVTGTTRRRPHCRTGPNAERAPLPNTTRKFLPSKQSDFSPPFVGRILLFNPAAAAARATDSLRRRPLAAHPRASSHPSVAPASRPPAARDSSTRFAPWGCRRRTSSRRWTSRAWSV